MGRWLRRPPARLPAYPAFVCSSKVRCVLFFHVSCIYLPADCDYEDPWRGGGRGRGAADGRIRVLVIFMAGRVFDSSVCRHFFESYFLPSRLLLLLRRLAAEDWGWAGKLDRGRARRHQGRGEGCWEVEGRARVWWSSPCPAILGLGRCRIPYHHHLHDATAALIVLPLHSLLCLLNTTVRPERAATCHLPAL